MSPKRAKIAKPVKFKQPALNPGKPKTKCPECNTVVFECLSHDPDSNEQRRALVALNSHLVHRHNRAPWPGIEVTDPPDED